MHQIADVEVAKNIMDANKRLADKNLKNLEDNEIFCVDFVGAIGSGKTTLIEEIIDNTDYKIGVLAGDVISKFDAERIKSHNVPVEGLNTGKECHLDAHLVGHGLQQQALVYLVGQLIYDNTDSVLIVFLKFRTGADHDLATAGGIGGADTAAAHNDAAGGEVRAGNML